jgi:hypothetical protein
VHLLTHTELFPPINFLTTAKVVHLLTHTELFPLINFLATAKVVHLNQNPVELCVKDRRHFRDLQRAVKDFSVIC